MLATRDAHDWYRSCANTIFLSFDHAPPELVPWMEAVQRLLRDRFSDHFDDEEAMIAAYERHNAEVRAEVPPARLVDWTPSDGWGPICAALELPVPDDPFPVTNTTNDFRAMAGLDQLE